MRVLLAILFVSMATPISSAATGDISFSILWNGSNDLDLVVTTPGGYIISHKSPQSPDGGILDREANKGGRTDSQPIENIFFLEGQAPRGKYCVYVDYCKQYGDTEATPYVLLVRRSIDGKTQTKKFKGVALPRDKLKFIGAVRNR